MSTDTFEKTNWGWQLAMFQKQVQEWVEYQFSRFQRSLPELPTGWSISSGLVDLLKILFWLLLGLFLAWLVWRLWQEFSPYLFSWLESLSNSNEPKKVATHEVSTTVLSKRAQEYSRQGNYREACRCIYLAMLQNLHERAIALQQPSRTDREYLQLLSSAVTSIQPYETLIITHEQLCFSDAEIVSENYQQCQQAYQEISQT